MSSADCLEVVEWNVPEPWDAAVLIMSDGSIINLRRYGHPGKTRLVLSHGNGLAIDAYLPFWELLIEDFDVVLFDVRNHGHNPPLDPAAHHWTRIARDMAEIPDGIRTRFGAARTVGVFHSLSAVATLMSTLRYGSRYDALVLFDPPIFPPEGHPLQHAELQDMAEMSRRAQSRPTSYSSPEAFAAQLARRPTFRHWLPGTHLLFAQTTLAPQGDGRWALRCPREFEARVFETNVDPTLWPALSKLNIPTLLIGADPSRPDATPPAAICHAIHEEIGVDYVMIPDTTHFLQIEQPLACGQALLSFLQRHGFIGAD
jgi:pimeloyl-ACP methyl ester carboxylesterase